MGRVLPAAHLRRGRGGLGGPAGSVVQNAQLSVKQDVGLLLRWCE